MRAIGAAFLFAGIVGAVVFGLLLSNTRSSQLVDAVLTGEKSTKDVDEMTLLSGEKTQGMILRERADMFTGLLVVSGLFAAGGLLFTVFSKPGTKFRPPDSTP
jgi:hypothetical protein